MIFSVSRIRYRRPAGQGIIPPVLDYSYMDAVASLPSHWSVSSNCILIRTSRSGSVFTCPFRLYYSELAIFWENFFGLFPKWATCAIMPNVLNDPQQHHNRHDQESKQEGKDQYIHESNQGHEAGTGN